MYSLLNYRRTKRGKFSCLYTYLYLSLCISIIVFLKPTESSRRRSISYQRTPVAGCHRAQILRHQCECLANVFIINVNRQSAE